MESSLSDCLIVPNFLEQQEEFDLTQANMQHTQDTIKGMCN